MIIHDGFYITGFTRQDKGEAGAVFVHYEDERTEARAPEIKEMSQYYAGTDTANYTITLPKPKPRKVTACAVVTRSSKNCYQATVYDARRIEYFRADTLDGLRRVVAKFFEKNGEKGAET